MKSVSLHKLTKNVADCQESRHMEYHQTVLKAFGLLSGRRMLFLFLYKGLHTKKLYSFETSTVFFFYFRFKLMPIAAPFLLESATPLKVPFSWSIEMLCTFPISTGLLPNLWPMPFSLLRTSSGTPSS